MKNYFLPNGLLTNSSGDVKEMKSGLAVCSWPMADGGWPQACWGLRSTANDQRPTLFVRASQNETRPIETGLVLVMCI